MATPALGLGAGILGIGSALEGAGTALGGIALGLGNAVSGLFQGIGEAAKAPDGAVRIKTRKGDFEINPVSASMAVVGGVSAYGLLCAINRWIVRQPGQRNSLDIGLRLPSLPDMNTGDGVDLALRTGLSPSGSATISRNAFTPGRDQVSGIGDAIDRLLARSGEVRDPYKGTFDPVASAQAPFQSGGSIFIPSTFVPNVTRNGEAVDVLELAKEYLAGPSPVDTNLEAYLAGGVSRARLREYGVGY